MNYDELIEREREKGGLLDVLKAIEAKEGCLTEEAIAAVAKAYGRYPSEIYETATFYTMLHVGKKAKHTLEICGSTCCDAAGAKDVIRAAEEALSIGVGETSDDDTWTLKRCECLGRCDTAPNVLIDGELITNATPDVVREAIRKAGN